MTCKNCTAPLQPEWQYCSTCGETAHPHRINLKHVLHEFIHGLLHADKGIFLLIKLLIVTPGGPALDYVQGMRKKFFNPVSFLLISGGLVFFLRLKLGFENNLVNSKIGYHISEFLHKFTTPIVILTIPLLAFFSWLFFRSTGKNYAENIVMNMYAMGEYHLLSILFTVLPSYFFPSASLVFTALGFVILAAYYFFSCKKFFGQDARMTLLKTIAIEICFIFCFAILMSIALFTYLIQTGVHVKDLQ